MEQNNRNQEILESILKTVEKDEKQQWVETVCTILLSLATVISAWCIYQSSQWNGEQYFHIEDLNIADRKKLQQEMQAVQRKSLDLDLFLRLASARIEGNDKIFDFLNHRLPPHLKKAIVAWQETDPLNNPSAPRAPFDMKEYVTPEAEEIRKYADKAAGFKKAANEADMNSDTYMLLSLILAMVLFFSGLSGVSKSYMRQRILLGVATAIFLAAIIWLLQLPVLL